MVLLVTTLSVAGKQKINEAEIIKAKIKLAEMVARDQTMRFEIINLGKKYGNDYTKTNNEITAYWRKIDHDNTQEIKRILYKNGWPDCNVYGEKYCADMWLLVQHADDLDLQKFALECLKKNSAGNKSQIKDYAYLYDRIQIKLMLPQKFGTQGYCKEKHDWEPFEIVDKANLDKLRQSIGLPSFQNYKKELDDLCN
jgi:regulator of replication initiation timing